MHGGGVLCKPRVFRDPHHDVEALHRRSGGAFAEVVETGGQDDAFVIPGDDDFHAVRVCEGVRRDESVRSGASGKAGSAAVQAAAVRKSTARNAGFMLRRKNPYFPIPGKYIPGRTGLH